MTNAFWALSCGTWVYAHDNVVHGDWDDRGDDFIFRVMYQSLGMVSSTCAHVHGLSANGSCYDGARGICMHTAVCICIQICSVCVL